MSGGLCSQPTSTPKGLGLHCAVLVLVHASVGFLLFRRWFRTSFSVSHSFCHQKVRMDWSLASKSQKRKSNRARHDLQKLLPKGNWRNHVIPPSKILKQQLARGIGCLRTSHNESSSLPHNVRLHRRSDVFSRHLCPADLGDGVPDQ